MFRKRFPSSYNDLNLFPSGIGERRRPGDGGAVGRGRAQPQVPAASAGPGFDHFRSLGPGDRTLFPTALRRVLPDKIASAITQPSLRKPTCASLIAQPNLREPTCASQLARANLREPTCASQLARDIAQPKLRETCRRESNNEISHSQHIAQPNLRETCRRESN